MLLSRVADALYWISRYLERAEHAARVIGVRLDLGLDRRTDSDGWDFERLYASLRLTRPSCLPPNPGSLIDLAVLDLSNRESVASAIVAARENARQVREEISTEMWEQINGLFLKMKQVRTDAIWSTRPHYLSRMIIEGIHLFQGVTDATMGHGEGWHYLRAGRFLERADATAALLGVQLRNGWSIDEGPFNQAEGVALLRSCSALEAYCRHYTADLRPERITEFLLLNPEFPRSVRFAASRVESSLRALSQHAMRGAGGRAERLAGRLHASLDYGQVDEILNDDPGAYLEGIAGYCTQIHAALGQSYMDYSVETALSA